MSDIQMPSDDQLTKGRISKSVYLPGLNGLRAIAALAVLIGHTTGQFDKFGLNNKIFGIDTDGNARGLALAAYGVTIFFTLSGFLITYLLLKEKETGSINIKNFYVRRILRIWPLYYLYFFVCIFTLLYCGIDFPKFAIPYYLFFAANVPFLFGGAITILVHLWSIGVEEQFYLFFPHIARLPNKKLFKITIALIAILFFARIVCWAIFRKYGFELPYKVITVNRFHMMLIGVVGAILYYNGNQRFLYVCTHKATQIVAWICVALLAANRFHIASVIDGELIAIVTVFLIVGQITKKNNLINLENKLFDFTGKISYGIYVIHPLLLLCFSRWIGHLPNTVMSYVLVYGLMLVTTILLSYLSYELYEKRFLKLKRKYATVKSSSTKNGL